MASQTASARSSIKHHPTHSTSFSIDDPADEPRGRKRRRSSALAQPQQNSTQSTTLRGRCRRRSLSKTFTSSTQRLSRGSGHHSPGRKHQKHSKDEEKGPKSEGPEFWEEDKRRSQSPSRSRSRARNGTPKPRRRQRTRTRSRSHRRIEGIEGSGPGTEHDPVGEGGVAVED